ncbi:MAG: PEP-CTERM sorting domain-containing protein [Microcoleus sp. CSU_2_2]|nr:PEP-CTERM sorting domain-containing protein [Microcoleus sp. SU_5_3]NJS11055.1 PEP-CTERM sorting domain-containing protein [Microcoleus sp. CSU_2_2]
MPTFFLNYFLIPTTGVLFAVVTVVSGGKAAVGAHFGAVSIVAKSSVSENLLLAQVNQPPQGNNPTNQTGGAVNRTPLPVKIPEPSTMAGLGLVASSLVVTRRRRLRN